MRRWPITTAALLLWAIPVCAAEADESGIHFFETRIRPILVNHCHSCHSASAKKLKGGLRLDSRDGVLKGGDSGPAIVLGQPERSRLIDALRYSNVDLQMPPKGKLADEQIADMVRWVKMSAPWPPTLPSPKRGGGKGGDSADKAPYKDGFDLQKRKASHWAWRPVTHRELAQPPSVRNSEWSKDPIDRFIFSKLEENRLTPASSADRRTLIRRLYFDLIGLPPTPQEVEAFVQSRDTNAYAKLVDGLLASARFGERWARHWLDLVRYAETLGHEFDFPIANAWRYRDYVIRALNADVPYDQFVMEHIAGDLLPDPRRHPSDGFNESVIGTGFSWLGEGKHSPVDARQEEADRFDNRIDVLTKTFLGLTVSCARCHDHKFDAISSNDYYALYGYLRSSRFTQAAINADQIAVKAGELAPLKNSIRGELAKVWTERAVGVGRYLLASSRVLVEKVEPVPTSVQTVATELNLDSARLQRWVKATHESAALDPSHPGFVWAKMAEQSAAKPARFAAAWQIVNAQLKERCQELETANARSQVFADFNRPSYEGWFIEGEAFGGAPARAGEIMIGSGADKPSLLSGGWAHSGVLSAQLEGVLRSPSFTINYRFLHALVAGQNSRINVVIDNHLLIRDPLYGSLKRVLKNEKPGWQTFDLKMWQGRRAYLEFADVSSPDLGEDNEAPKPAGYIAVRRVIVSNQRPPAWINAPPAVALLAKANAASLKDLAVCYEREIKEALEALQSGALPPGIRGQAQAALIAWLLDSGLLASPEMPKKLVRLLEQYHGIEASLPEPVRVPAMTEGTPENEHVFIRGSPKYLGPEVPRRFLEALGGKHQAPAYGSGRLELARQLVDRSDPLVSRVIVNRIWHHLFGRGIVSSVDNFGVLGEKPSHPDLLDHLAERFVRDGWSVKKLIRAIVLSATYQMSSKSVGGTDAIDPENRLFHRASVRRLEGEAIRDEILALSGRLDPQVFGPSVEVHLTPSMLGRGRPRSSGPLDGDGRRSIYVKVRRNFLPPMMLAFDMPAPFSTMGRRTVSNVPAQALIMLNDPFVFQQAQVWAKRMLSEKDSSPSERITKMYLMAFARSPRPEELSAGLSFVENQIGGHAASGHEKEATVGAWTDLAHVLLNTKEFIYIE